MTTTETLTETFTVKIRRITRFNVTVTLWKLDRRGKIKEEIEGEFKRTYFGKRKFARGDIFKYTITTTNVMQLKPVSKHRLTRAEIQKIHREVDRSLRGAEDL